MSNSPSGSKFSIPNAVAVTENADDKPDITGNSNSNSISETSMRSSDSKEGRKSRSDSKGRKSSHKRSSGHRRRTKHSPMRSSSRSEEGSCAGEGSSEMLLGDDGDGEAKPRSSRTSRSSRSSPKRDNRSISPKSFYDDDEDTKHRAKGSGRSPTRSKGSVSTRHSRPSAELLSPSGQSGGSVSTARSAELLYGNEEDAKIKAKSLSQKRSSKPGVQHLSPFVQSKSTVSTARSHELLYGHDEDVKAKAKASRSPKRSSRPGVEVVSLSGETRSTVSSARSTEVLYGDEDAKAKAKGSSRNPKRSQKPGIELVHENVSPSGQSRSTFGSAQSTEILYGMSDKDSKAKAKAFVGSSSKRSSDTNSTATEILYGNEADAKIKSKSSRNNPISSNPGVEVVTESRSLAVSSIPIEEDGGSSIPFKIEGAVVQEGKSKNRKSQKQKQPSYTKWIIVALVLILIGGGSTAFIALREDDDNQGTQNQDADYIQNPTEPPKAPAGSPDSTPTAPPSNKVVRDPASAEECAAIANNSTIIPGNTTTVHPNNWNVNIQINVKGKTGMTDEMIQELMDSIQELLLPSMAGCSVDQRKLMGMASPIIRGAPRGLEVVFDQARFAILFAYVKGEVQADAVCVDTPTPELCYIVLVEFVLYLDSDISSAAVEDVLLEELLDGNDIVSKLNLGDSFASANATNVTDVTPSEVPSSSPTDAPSASPSTSGSPTESPTVPSATNGPDVPTVVPVSEPTDAPDSSTSDPVAQPTLGPATPPSIPLDGPTSVPIESSPPSAISPSETPSTSPSSSPTSMPPPTVSPTILSSSSPSRKPSVAPSAAPTVRASAVPSATPTEAPTGAPVSNAPSAEPSVATSSTPSISPSVADSSAPSPSPSPAPSLSASAFPSLLPTIAASSMMPTQCFCLDGVTADGAAGPACDGSEAIMDIGCGSCTGVSSCIALRENINAPGTISPIGDDSCQQLGACDSAMVVLIGKQSCIGDYACQGRHINVGSLSCRGENACAVDLAFAASYGQLVVRNKSCNWEYACYSKEIKVGSHSCGRGWACAGRTKMYVADSACIGAHACSATGIGTIFTNGIIYQAQTETSYFGTASCTCENCCVCMVRVIPGRCKTPGECCDEDDPTLKVTGVLDNTEEEMKQAFGVTDLDQLFL